MRISDWSSDVCSSDLMVSASIGGVVIDHSGVSARDLLAQADTACYMAKELGRNRVHFYSERDDETIRRHGEMEWANRLRWAVGYGRLVLLYQQHWPLPLEAGARPDIEMLPLGRATGRKAVCTYM